MTESVTALDQTPSLEDLLRRVALYQTLKSRMKIDGVLCLVFGAPALLSGLNGAIEGSALNWILAVLGAVIVGAGVWLLKSPGPRALLVEGVVLWPVGLWNLVVSFLSLFGGDSEGGSAFFIVIGVTQIAWAWRTVSRQRSFIAAARSAEDQEALQAGAIQLAQLVDATRHGQQWRARTTRRFRAMHFDDRQMSLDQLMLLLLRGKLPPQRTSLSGPGDDQFRDMIDFPPLHDYLMALRNAR